MLYCAYDTDHLRHMDSPVRQSIVDLVHDWRKARRWLKCQRAPALIPGSLYRPGTAISACFCRHHEHFGQITSTVSRKSSGFSRHC